MEVRTWRTTSPQTLALAEFKAELACSSVEQAKKESRITRIRTLNVEVHIYCFGILPILTSICDTPTFAMAERPA